MGGRHVHGVGEGFSEEGQRDGDGRWNDNLFDRLDLTLMAHFNVPHQVFVKRQPPKVI
jgi:hypothetical protein